MSTEIDDMDVDAVVPDVPAAMGLKGPAAAEDDAAPEDERRCEEEMRVKVPKANYWVHPPDISELLHKSRMLQIRHTATIARSRKVREDLARRHFGEDYSFSAT